MRFARGLPAIRFRIKLKAPKFRSLYIFMGIKYRTRVFQNVRVLTKALTKVYADPPTVATRRITLECSVRLLVVFDGMKIVRGKIADEYVENYARRLHK